MSAVCLETAGEPAGLRSVVLRRPAVGGKGKARGSSRASEGENKVFDEDEELASESGAKDPDVMIE